MWVPSFFHEVKQVDSYKYGLKIYQNNKNQKLGYEFSLWVVKVYLVGYQLAKDASKALINIELEYGDDNEAQLEVV